MLTSLTINNTAIIDSLTIDFGEKMNCMTGETGAGKSIILDSLCCLLGERASKESIRSGEKEARVTGVFNAKGPKISEALLELGITPEDDGTLILSRAYTENKNTCRINGNIVTLSALRKIGELLVDVHGQHASHALLSEPTHIELLDLFAGDEISAVKSEYHDHLKELSNVENELSEFSGDPQKRAQLIDLYTFQLNEINSANLKIGEDTKLEERQRFFDNNEIISQSLSAASELLSGRGGYDSAGALDALSSCESYVSKIERFGDDYKSALEKVRDAKFAIEDASEYINQILENSEFDRDEAERVAIRLDVIYELKRKYGKTLEEVLEHAEKVSKELEKLEKSEAYVSELNIKKDEIIAKLNEKALKMRKLREKSARMLENGVMQNLSDMEMSKVKFAVSFDERSEFNSNGLDNVRFLVSTNPGEKMLPLVKIASGGELSRIMLAIKSVLADVDEIPVLVFDEIDTGISGAAAKRVAEKFKMISKKHQLICVSHLAQIAAIADVNVFVKKIYEGEGVRTSAETLDDTSKVREIARLLDGDSSSEISLKHAEEIIKKLRE